MIMTQRWTLLFLAAFIAILISSYAIMEDGTISESQHITSQIKISDNIKGLFDGMKKLTGSNVGSDENTKFELEESISKNYFESSSVTVDNFLDHNHPEKTSIEKLLDYVIQDSIQKLKVYIDSPKAKRQAERWVWVTNVTIEVTNNRGEQNQINCDFYIYDYKYDNYLISGITKHTKTSESGLNNLVSPKVVQDPKIESGNDEKTNNYSGINTENMRSNGLSQSASIDLSHQVKIIPDEIAEAKIDTSKPYFIFDVTPANAHIKIDNNDIHYNGGKYLTTPGNHKIQISNDGYENEMLDVHIENNGVQPIEIELKKYSGSLAVNTDDPKLKKAKIYLDGKRIGKIPLKQYQLQSGTYDVEIKGKHHFRKEYKVAILDTGVAYLDVEQNTQKWSNQSNSKFSVNFPSLFVYYPSYVSKYPVGYWEKNRKSYSDYQQTKIQKNGERTSNRGKANKSAKAEQSSNSAKQSNGTEKNARKENRTKLMGKFKDGLKNAGKEGLKDAGKDNKAAKKSSKKSGKDSNKKDEKKK